MQYEFAMFWRGLKSIYRSYCFVLCVFMDILMVFFLYFNQWHYLKASGIWRNCFEIFQTMRNHSKSLYEHTHNIEQIMEATSQQMYSHLPPISKTIQIRRTKHARHGRAGVGRAARTYLQKLCMDTGCSLEDLPNAMNDRNEWRGRVREICASGARDDDNIYIYIYIYIYIHHKNKHIQYIYPIYL